MNLFIKTLLVPSLALLAVPTIVIGIESIERVLDNEAKRNDSRQPIPDHKVKSPFIKRHEIDLTTIPTCRALTGECWIEKGSNDFAGRIHVRPEYDHPVTMIRLVYGAQFAVKPGGTLWLVSPSELDQKHPLTWDSYKFSNFDTTGFDVTVFDQKTEYVFGYSITEGDPRGRNY